MFVTSNDYNGINVEARNNTGVYASPLINGYQRGAFPTNRTIIFGIDLKF
jgi:hypothetical protein